MPSTESDALREHYQSMTDRMAANPGLDLVSLRSMLEELATRAREPEEVSYRDVDADGVRALWCLPHQAEDDRVIVYLHGGGFVSNSADSHRKLAAHLARAAGVKALLVDYRLAPEHPFPAQIDDAVTAYRWLLSEGFTADHLATAGDSAGGNLAITLPLQLRNLGEPTPAAIIGFSPWVDMEHTGETLKTNAETDALVSRDVVEMMSSMFLGANGSPTDPLANPLHADLTDFPPIYLTAGGSESLKDNAERLVAQASGAGVDATLEIAEGQQHVYLFMVGRAPEADETINRAAAWLRPHLGL